jgi:hypothetical protein
MTLRSALLTFRIQRFETTVVVAAAGLSVVVSALVIWLFTAGGYGQCLASDGPVLTSLCQSTMASWLYRIINMSIGIVPIFPVVAGMLAGGPIVARELEAGTARLAWSLGPSRMRWFAQRALPILAMVIVASLAIGLTAQALMHVLHPAIDFDRSFAGFRARGVFVGMEALLIASIALAFGAMLGRLVPTLIVTLLMFGALGTAFDKVERTSLLSEAVLSSGESFQWETDYFLESRLKFPNGEILTYEEAVQTHPEVNGGWEGDQPPYEDVVLSIPGSRFLEVERREALALGALSLGFVGLAAVAVVRRRPR